MSKNIFNLNRKNYILYIFFSFLLIYLTIFSTINATAKSYNVENVEIIEPYDLNFKKEIVIDKAFVSAFQILISRIVKSENLKNINLKDLSIIRPMVDAFLIEDEKFIENNYIGKFNIIFDRKAILGYLNSKNITSSSPKKNEIFFLPVYFDVSKNELLMFSENEFYLSWNKINDQIFLIDYVLPGEDLEDFAIINKNLSNIENFDFNKIIKKYNKNEYIISIFIKTEKKLRVLSRVFFKDQYSLINSTYNLENKKNDKNKIINDLKITYENEWKKRNEINLSIKLPLTVSVESKNLKLIKKFEDTLNKSDFTFDYNIEKITSDATIYKIIYNNTPDKFISDFKDQDFKIDISNEVWKVQ